MTKHDENEEEHKAHHKPINKFWFIVGGIIVLIIILVIFNSQRAPKPYCGDGVCNANENKCSCQSDCGTCFETKGCSQYSCDANNQCVAGTPFSNCCGNGKCEAKENSNTCSQDCGTNQVINYGYEAINRVASREDIKKDWENLAKSKNCGAKYTDVLNAAFFVSRVTVSQSLIQCEKYSHFSEMIRATNTSSNYEQYNNHMINCDKKLIEIYNKALRGYKDSSYNFAISEPCFDCDDFYAVSLGCVNADADISKMNGYGSSGCESGICIVQGSSEAIVGSVIVDAKTGAVYW